MPAGAGAAGAAPALEIEKGEPPATAAKPAASTATSSLAASNNTYSAISFWILMSCSVILFNKFLYVTVFPYPITLTCIHMAFASTATWSLRLTGYLEGPSFGWAVWMRNVAPIGVLYAISLATSNLGAARLSVSFVQMIKALTPLVTLAASVVLRVESASRKQAAVVAAMCVGIVVASYGEILWNTVGVAFQVTSVVAEGSRLVVTQILLQQHLPKSSPLVSVSIFAPPSFLLLAPVAYTFEGNALATLATPEVGFLVLLNTLTAFVLNIAVVILVSRTSGLILTLAGIVKDIALIIVSVFIFWNPVTLIQIVGYAIALLGLNAYNDLKARKEAQPPLATVLHTALTNKQALFIYAGCTALAALSLLSTSAYHSRV